MAFPREDKKERGKNLWRRWVDYALGIIIEASSVAVISLAALGLMYLIKILIK